MIIATTKNTVAFNKFATSVKRRNSAPVSRKFTPFKILIPGLTNLSLASNSFFKITNNSSNSQTLPVNFHANKVLKSVGNLLVSTRISKEP